MPLPNPAGYINILEQLKLEIRTARVRATRAVNAELLQLYWRVGNIILKQQQTQGWGAKIILTLSTNIRQEFPNLQVSRPATSCTCASLLRFIPAIDLRNGAVLPPETTLL
ncbi:MAG: hypothetical protein JWQ14_2631 [Adhaeribacter sp.]|nr:hypothetical protein [Adhaeribacter sp.]